MLNIYVPADQRGFKRSWPIDIIPRLKIWLGVSDLLGDDVLQQIFIRDDLELLDEDLEKKGIRAVDGVQRDPKHTIISPNSFTSSTIAVPLDDRPRGTSFQESVPGIASSIYTQYPAIETSDDARPRFRASTNSMGRETARYEFQDPTHGDIDKYRDILNEVVAAAQSAVIPDQRAILPLRISMPDTEKPRQAFGPAVVNNGRNAHRDRKVGAAGELYVCDLRYETSEDANEAFRFLNC